MKHTSKHFVLLWLAMSMVSSVCAQQWIKVNVHESDYNSDWTFPYESDQFSHFDFSANQRELRAHRLDETEADDNSVLFDASKISSITFEDEVIESEQTHNKYQVYTLNVTTNGRVGVSSKEEYVDCFVSLDGKDGYNMYSGSGRIRGRGNSTWAWYDKKPYRIKLDKKHKMLGLDANKDWVLLANYRDVTDLMNAFVFEVARWMGMPYVNHTRYVELFLDGDYKGLYLLTEQVEQGKSRVDVADDGGILLAMDLDDGPSGQTASSASFYSTIYSMPMCVKYPKDVTITVRDSIQNLLAELETAIQNVDYDTLDSLMDIKSFMTMAMIQEYVENVEICAPRSIYMYKDVDGKWAMGPFWDWDAGFDFDWSDMYGNTYFRDYKELVLGTDPANRKNMYGSTPHYFTDMFKSDRYTKEYKALWNSVKDSIFTRNWAEMEKYISELNKGAYSRDMQRWPIVKHSWWYDEPFVVSEEIAKMKTWLQNRTAYLDVVINNYPETDNEGNGDESKYGVLATTVSGTTIDVYVMVSKADGYSQPDRINLSPAILGEALGLTENEIKSSTVTLAPLNANGSEGGSTANGIWGAWFDANGNTCNWGWNAHVFVEPTDTDNSDPYSWAYGCHPDYCTSGDSHTITMRYSISRNRQISYVYVNVHFGIDRVPDGTYENKPNN